MSFYTRLEASLKEQCRKEREKINSKPLGMAFVTFEDEGTAAMYVRLPSWENKCICVCCIVFELTSSLAHYPTISVPRILKDFNACKCHGCQCRREPRSSIFSGKLHTQKWTIAYAPDPQNVYW